MPRIEEPPEPWRSFFAEVDSRLSEDIQSPAPRATLISWASCRNVRNDLDPVTVATPPENYEDRLAPNLAAHEAQRDLTLQLWLASYW